MTTNRGEVEGQPAHGQREKRLVGAGKLGDLGRAGGGNPDCNFQLSCDKALGRGEVGSLAAGPS